MIFDDTSNANLRYFQSVSDSGQCYAIAAYFNIDSTHSKTIKILFSNVLANAKIATAFSWRLHSVRTVGDILCHIRTCLNTTLDERHKTKLRQVNSSTA